MYAQLIDQTITHVHQKGVATKILQSMDRIRNEFDPIQARRWPTELLQNARDLAHPDRPVRVQIELTDDAVCFRHSGKPFSVKDILSIVNQVSSKKPGEGVGQFGTGFMSTFQLSMKVEVRSFLKDVGEPYRPFHICLDRSGATHEAISRAIFEAMNALKAVDQAQPAAELDPDGFNTEFRYHLNDDRSRKIARIGMDDLRRTLALTMLFSEQLGETELLFHTGGTRETVCFRRGERAVFPNGVERQDILVGAEKHTFFLLRRGGIGLAAEWSQAQGFLPLAEGTPRLYIDFPLVGSERFPFPVVVNSLALRPNEPRSGVSLVEHADSLDARENRALMDRAAALYQDFFTALFALDPRGAKHLIAIPAYETNKEWSESWVRGHIYDCLYAFLSKQKLLPVGGARRALAETELRLVRAKDPGTRRELACLCGQVRSVLTPEDEVDWYAAFSGYEPPKGKVATLKDVLDQAPKIILHGLREGYDPVEWLARLYDLGMTETAAATAIRAGNAAIFPSQDKFDLLQGRLYTAKEIFTDPGIHEILKDAAEQLDGLESSGSLEIRKKLLHGQFRPAHREELPPVYPFTSFASYIVTRSDRQFQVKNYYSHSQTYEKLWEEAWKLLLASGPDREMYELAKAGWRDLPDWEDCSHFKEDRGMWDHAYRGVLGKLLNQVKDSGSLDTLAKALAQRSAQAEVIHWLNLLYAKAALYLRVSDWFHTCVLPNQYGKFCAPAQLKLDSLGDQELKSIALCFKEERGDCDLFQVLADGRLTLSGWNLGWMTLREAAGRLNAALIQFFSHSNLSQASPELQDACTRLLSWLRDHTEEAKAYFPTFYKEEDQMKLLTPRAAVGLRKKADRLNELMALAGTDSEEELKKLLREGKDRQAAEAAAEEAAAGRGGFDPDSGLWFGEDWDDLDRAARDARLRRIGAAGERCAFQAVVDYLTDHGCTVTKREGDRTAVLTAEDGTGRALVHRLDTADYHQAGWDISVLLKDEGEVKNYYLEVKTHTPGSVARSLLPLSNAQMQKAASHGEHYVVLEVIYDEGQDRAVELRAFRDIPAQLARGRLVSAEGRYLLTYDGVPAEPTEETVEEAPEESAQEAACAFA